MESGRGQATGLMASHAGWTWLFAALLVTGLVLLAVVAVRVVGGGVSRAGPRGAAGGAPGFGRARELLDERYARGELTAEEYEQRRRVLDEGA